MKRILILLATLTVLMPGLALASSFALAPANSSVTVGSTFTVQVRVSSPDQAVNAVSGVLGFPASSLQVVSLSKAGSEVDMWVKEPSFSNANGTISFEGAILNPGYQGGGGQVIGVTFRAIAAGSAQVSFRSASILANDGQGTNVTVGLPSAQYDLRVASPAVSRPTTPAAPTATVASAVTSGITSATHTSPDLWSRSADAQFSWQLPDDVTDVQYGIDRVSGGVPGTATVGRLSSVTLPLGDFVDDGAYWFHLRFGKDGKWGPVQSRRILVDRVPPESMEVSEVASSDLTNPRREFHVDVADASSGVDRLEVSWDGGQLRVPGTAAGRFVVPALPPGTHDISIRAVDRAGNGRVAHALTRIDPIPSPTLSIDLDGVEPVAYGSAPGATDVLVRFSRRSGEEKELAATVGKDGSWKLAYAAMARGEWDVRVVARDERGALSLPVGPVSVSSFSLLDTMLRVLPWALALMLGAGLILVLRRRSSNVTDVPVIVQQ